MAARATTHPQKTMAATKAMSDNSASIPTVYIIAGPTAVGKTDIAIRLAEKLNTEIVSADSRQCYKGMGIGTAKPSPEELARVKHSFIDEFPVEEHITAADYETMSLLYLKNIFKTHDTAVVCGGTGLYIKALCEGLDEMPAVNEDIAAAVDADYKEEGIAWLQYAVQQEDPLFWQQGETQNPARLMRALVFIRSTGESIIHYQTGEKKTRPYRFVKIALELPREELYARINMRVDKMMDAGLLQEAQALYNKRHLKNLQTVGYSELFDYIDGKYSLEEAVDKIKQHTRNYSKRQLTWFRKDKSFIWLQADGANVVGEILAIKKPLE